jgi:hypothetical protein
VTKTHLSKLLIFLIAAAALTACNKTNTSIPLSWRNPAFEHTAFKKLLVIGVGENDGARRLFEDTFAKALAQQGTSAQASWGLLPQSTQLSEEQIRGAVEGGSFDGVLVSRLLSVFKTNTTFRLETNLYSVATADLVWSGQSETLNPESLTDVIDSMTAAVAKKLKEEKLIP